VLALPFLPGCACAQSQRLRGKAVYFIRITTKAVTDKTVEQARTHARARVAPTLRA
jgi:hypothetical protein